MYIFDLFLRVEQLPVSYSFLTSPELAKFKYTRFSREDEALNETTETSFYRFDLFLRPCTILSQLQTTKAHALRNHLARNMKVENEVSSDWMQVTIVFTCHESKFTKVERDFHFELGFFTRLFTRNLVVESRERSAGGR